MSINKNPNDFLNMPAFDVLRRMQEQFNNSAFAVTMRELQRIIGNCYLISYKGGEIENE